jgi:hypothetical protein
MEDGHGYEGIGRTAQDGTVFLQGDTDASLREAEACWSRSTRRSTAEVRGRSIKSGDCVKRRSRRYCVWVFR